MKTQSGSYYILWSDKVKFEITLITQQISDDEYVYDDSHSEELSIDTDINSHYVLTGRDQSNPNLSFLRLPRT